jgi:transitional endoplasmic reticulum ATPase
MVGSKGNGSVESSRVVAQVLTFLDGLKGISKEGRLIVIGCSSNPNNIDPAMRRPGRLDREYEIPSPNVPVRKLILRHILNKVAPWIELENQVDLDQLSSKLVGFVGSDVEDWITQLCSGDTKVLSQKIIDESLTRFSPKSRRGSTVEYSKTNWNDIGGLEDVKAKLRLITEHSDAFDKIGLPLPKGILLYGPPGCSKTSLVRALASSMSGFASFLSSDGASIYSSYFGEAEANIRQLFSRARSNAPCLLFIDEIDSIVTSRSSESSGGSAVQNRVLSTLLNEMDGVQSTKECPVMVVAATNYPEKLDDALMRPGRFDHLFYVNVFVICFSYA